MPHYKTINLVDATQIFIWKITETLNALFKGVQLRESSLLRLNDMKSEIHKKGFLSIRKLLQKSGYTDFDLYYDQSGKPYLKDGRHISITHSFDFSAIIISDRVVGIDIELRREKIKKIADKFIDCEFSFLNKEEEQNYISKLTIIWGVKESLYKICTKPKMSFKHHVKVNLFNIKERQGEALLKIEDIDLMYPFHFEKIENFILVYIISES